MQGQADIVELQWCSSFFFSPIRKDGTPMPSSVLKFDIDENVQDDIKKTKHYGSLFGLTTPKVKASHCVPGVDAQDPSSLMQIDLCGGMFGLPEFASAPPVHTFASVLQAELAATERTVDVVPIINEALERRMRGFTMSSRSVRKVDLSAMYKIIRFVGHGILNRAHEGAKRGKKSPALAAGFLNPADIDELDAEGCFMQELCGKRTTTKEFFANFVSHEERFAGKFQREVVLGLCHNDLHGGNLLLDSQGLVWLIDFATVKNDIHVLMDLTKFMASCLFLYLESNANEANIRMFAKLLATTPDATTALPILGGGALKEDKVAAFVLDLLTRLRHCMCIYEVGDDCPSNDGVPFALALFSWSSRMLSYSEPSLYQKSRALYYAIVCAQRVRWEAGIEVGPTAVEWIEEFRQVWEGQKGRRLSTSATQVQNLAFEFDVEFPRYLAQVGTAEAWSTDFLTREKVHATDHCTAVRVGFVGCIFPRIVHLAPVTKAMLAILHPVHEQYMAELLKQDHFFGRLVILGGSGTGKSMLTRQLFSEVSQRQLVAMYGGTDNPDHLASEKSKNQVLGTKIFPLRLPIVDLGRILEADPDTSLDADPVGDMLTQWVQKKYGQDSVPHKLILDVRGANLAISPRRSSLISSDSTGIVPRGEKAVDDEPKETSNIHEMTGLFLLLDGYDEAAGNKQSVLEFVRSLLLSEPGHYVIMTSRPGSIAGDERYIFSQLGFQSFMMCELKAPEAERIVKNILCRLKDPQELVDMVLRDAFIPAYETLRRIPLVLTLLVHVLRKFATQSQAIGLKTTAASKTEIMKKTEVYQRAVRLILHQSDSAKFALREGRSDQAMVRRLEMMKTPRARKIFQTISWHAQSAHARAFKWRELTSICVDTEMLSALEDAFNQGRMPIFEKVEGSDGDESVQFNHLSFQELMAGEYAAAIVQHAHSKSSTSAYMNFFLSSSTRSLERDRLSEQWWLQVWMHVCEMLGPAAFKEWCVVLAEDEQSKFRVGRRLPQLVILPQWSDYWWEVTSIDWDDQSFRKVPRPKGCSQRTGLFSGSPFLLDDLATYKIIPLTHHAARWEHYGVCEIMRTAATVPNNEVVENLLELKVHFGADDGFCFDTFFRAMSSPLPLTAVKPLVEIKAQASIARPYQGSKGTTIDINIVERGVEKAWWHALGMTRGFRELMKMPKCWHFDEIRAGTWQLDPDVDPNFTEPSTQLTLLMVAAGFGQIDIVKKLLCNTANVHAQNQEGCTALTFAAESHEQGTADCLKLLIEAGSDIHHIAGKQRQEPEWRFHNIFWVGLPSAVGNAVCRLGDEEKLDILLRSGYDINLKSGSAILIAEAATSGNVALVDKLNDLGLVDPSITGSARIPDPLFTVALDVLSHAAFYCTNYDCWHRLVDLGYKPSDVCTYGHYTYWFLDTTLASPQVWAGDLGMAKRSLETAEFDWSAPVPGNPLPFFPRSHTLCHCSNPNAFLLVFDYKFLPYKSNSMIWGSPYWFAAQKTVAHLHHVFLDTLSDYELLQSTKSS